MSRHQTSASAPNVPGPVDAEPAPAAAVSGKARAAAGHHITGEDADAGKREPLEEPRAGTARGTATRQQARGAQQEATEPADGTASSGRGGRGGSGQPGPAGRTWTIELPAGIPLLSLNQRLHYHEKNRRTQAIKGAAITVTRYAKVPRLERAFIVVEYQPPDKRHRDADNPIASAKAAIDGLIVAGVLEDDECPRYVTGVYCTIGQRYPRGRLVLRVSEVETAGEAA